MRGGKTQSLYKKELQLLHSLNSAINTGAPLEDVLQLTVDGVREIYAYAACDIYLYHPERDALEMAALSVDSGILKKVQSVTGLTAKGLIIPLFEGSNFRDIVHGRKTAILTDMVKVFEDFTSNRALKRLARQVARICGFRFALRAPLVAMGEVIGVMGVARSSDINEGDAAAIERFASQAALTIRKARAERALAGEMEELEGRVRERTASLREANERLRHEILERKNAERMLKRDEELIRASLSEKEVLIREIHHRVKNNMQIISSLIKLQSSYALDAHHRELFRAALNRIRSMALVHKRLYASESFTDVDLKEYLRHLVLNLSSSYQVSSAQISLALKAGDVTLTISEAIPCGIIVNELLSNALRHAFPDGRKGSVEVELARCVEEGSPLVSLAVSDDGVGLPEGFDARGAETLGYQLVHSLAEKQLGGRLDVSAGQGTRVRVLFQPGLRA